LITERTIINFLEGKCDARDAAIVYACLKENPTKLEEHFREEWEDFQPVQVLTPEISGKLWDGIKKNTNPAAVRYSFARWLAVAALVILVVGLPWHFISKKQGTGTISTATAAKARNIFNNTLTKMSFTLSDGSKVELLPNSTLSYSENFDSLNRNVILNGGANFYIAKDIAKPFTVYSHSVLTTVLGTRFTVKSYEANNTTVVLHEGRVMIKISNPASKVNKHEFYLTPGDIFILNKVNASSRINNVERNAANPERNAANAERISANAERIADSLSTDSLSARVIHIEKDKDDRYLFNNYPLDVVFDQLQVIYNTTIVYDKSKLGNRSFIGKIDKKDSLYTILKSIALLNNFSLQRQGDTILVY
jgi:transmembrane sensor